jgi:dihydrolipoyl dehydrogenase
VADSFDVVVVGAGPGGYVAAIRAAQLGLKTACIEKNPTLGGTCLNVGCIPSKALLDSSELFELAAHRFGKHGIKVKGIELDLPALLARKDQVVKELTQGVAGLLKRGKIETIFGAARLVSKNSVAVKLSEGGERTVETKNIILATGSEPVELPFLKFDGNLVVDSTGALSFDRVPEHMVVVGGGYIGLELGSVWKRLGAKVTVVEFLPRIVPMADVEVGQALHRSLQKQGLEFQLETKVTGATIKGAKATLTAETKDGQKISYDCDRILVSVGRRGYVDGLGLSDLGIDHDPKMGKIKTDIHFKTNVPNIYAIGDVIAGPMLAHKAEDEGVACAEVIAGKPGHVNYDTIPSVIYTWPEMASVGITEEQAKERGLQYKIGKAPFAANGRAKAMDEKEGFVKIIAEAKTDRVLGVHIFGPRASDLIAEAVTTMEFAGSAEDIARICHSHPTLSETVKEAGLAVDKRTINC